MITLVAKHRQTALVRAVNVRFSKDRLFVELSDGRQLGVPFKKVPWLKWLATAHPRQRGEWTIEPNGFAIYWPSLDDGIEVCHLLE